MEKRLVSSSVIA